MREKLLSLLRERPRTLEELSKITGQSQLSIQFHLIGLPVKEKVVNGTAVLYLENEVNRSNPKTEESYHMLSGKKSQKLREKSKKTKNRRSSGLQLSVDKSDHGWLTKPLTLDDYAILSTLNGTAIKVLRFLYLGYTQSQIAKMLKITRQAVNKHVKKLLNAGFIKKRMSLHSANSNKDVVYDVRKAVAVYFNLGKKRNVQDCQPKNNWDVSSPQKPLFTVHRLQLAFHILSQSQPFTTNVKSFVKTYNPRGWTGYIYLLGNVRIRALPHKVIAELTEDIEFNEQITAEEAVVRVINMLKSAVEAWLKELSEDGFELELSHPYVMNAPEFAFKSKLVKQYIKKLREQQFVASCIDGLRGSLREQQELDVWIDDSPAKEGEGEYAHIETNDCDTADIIDIAIKNLAHINEYMKKIDIVAQDVQNVKVLIEGGLNIQQQIQQLMSVVAYLLKKDAEREELRKENEELRKRIEELEKKLGG